MSSNSNTSQFVKTYGKPRRIQGLGHESLWHNDLTDNFDKCLGIEDVQQTTFISPEPVRSVSLYKPAKNKKVENKMKTVNGWSVQLHSTLSGRKVNSTMEKKNIEHSSKNNCRKKLLIGSIEKKKIKNSLGKIDSNCLSKPNMNSKVVPASVKKPKKKIFMLSKEQCSTPFQKSTILASRNKSIIMSSNKKKKKKNIKINLACSIDDASYSSKLPKKLDCSLKEMNDKYNHLDQSVQISGCCILKPFNRELCSKNKNKKNAFINQRTNHQSVLNTLNVSRRYKKKKIASHISNKKNLNWYNKILNDFCSEELNFPIKSYNKNQSDENILTLEESLENYSNESVIICDKNNVVAKPSEQQLQFSPCTFSKNESFQSLKYIDKSLSIEELDTRINSTKSNKYIIKNNQYINDGVFEESQVSVLSNSDSSKVLDNSLYLSCYQFENKVIKNTECSNICTSDNDLSVDYTSFNVNGPSIDYEQSQLKTQSMCNNSTCMISNRVILSSVESDTKLLNISRRNDNNSSFNCVNCNTILSVPVKNIGFQSNNSQFVNNVSESQILEDITNSFDQFIIKESIFEEFDKSLNFSINKSTFTHNSNNSSSNLYNDSSSSKQKSIIYKRSDIDSKDNEDLKSLFLCENNESLEASSIIYSSKTDSLKCKNDICLFNSNEIVSDQTLHDQSQDGFITICRPNICRSIVENKCINSDSDNSYTEIENKFQSDCDRTNSLLNQSDTSIENISSIEYEGETVYENQMDFKNISPVKYKEIFISEDQTTISNNGDLNDMSENSVLDLFKNVSRRKRYAGRFTNYFQEDSYKKSADENNDEVQKLNEDLRQYDTIWSQQQNVSVIHLEPGKKWRRSMVILRSFVDGYLDQSTNFIQYTNKGRKWISTVDDVLRQQSMNTTYNQTLNQSKIERNLTYCRLSQRNSIENEIAREYIFNQCKQEKPLSFDSWLEPMSKKKWKKIGEGVYGEVFSYNYYKGNVVVKVMPVEGENYVNNERQKFMFEVYSEILIATELNKLSDDNNWNQTSSFCKLKSISCVQGKYPKHLIKLWEQYNEDKGSDNDNPNILPDNQMFMILQMEDGGIDVESFVFNSAYQALFAFLQTVFALAIAEQQFDFEHRDLHIGNILVKKILTRKRISYKLDGETFTLPSQGVKITIIDFTLSRMSHLNKSVYNDLANDSELFTANGDYQFEIYRLMREETNNQWNSYKPKTNIYWLHYLLDKMLTSVHYKNTATTIHSTGLKNLNDMKNSILCYNSVKSFAESDMILTFFK